MTEDEKDDFVENLTVRAIEAVGPEEAPGVLWAAFLTAHLRHNPLWVAVLAIEACLRRLRQELASKIRQRDTFQ